MTMENEKDIYSSAEYRGETNIFANILSILQIIILLCYMKYYI